MNRLTLLAGAILALSFSACSKSADKEKPGEKSTVAGAASSTAGANSVPTPSSPYKSVDQRVSYGIGYKVGSGLARENLVVVDQEAIKTGLTDGLSGAKTRIAEADLQAAFNEVQQKARAALAAAGEKQQAVGTEFLAKNKTRLGVTVTPSGLQYEVMTKGNGPKPKATDTVKVHYHGTLIDGTVFDSSVQRGEPFQTRVTGVIQGWIEALQLMSVGDKWKLYIPPSLGYGPNANGKIPPNSVLIFEVQLISIQ